MSERYKYRDLAHQDGVEGGLESETVEYGNESHGARKKRITVLTRPATFYQLFNQSLKCIDFVGEPVLHLDPER